MPPFILTPLLHNHHHLCFLDHVFSTITTTTTTTITSTSYVPFSPAFSIPISIIPICMAEISPSPNLSLCLDEPREPAASLNFNVMVIVAAMLCALICALGLHSMLQCVFQCTQRALTEPVEWVSFRRRNSGLKKKEMVALPTSTYAGQGSSPSSPSADCAICLSDFSDGEKIRVLPKCNHRFHVVCIDKWLLSNSSCPTCRQRLKSHDSLPNSLNQIVTAS